jgi:hypothetical protein
VAAAAHTTAEWPGTRTTGGSTIWPSHAACGGAWGGSGGGGGREATWSAIMADSCSLLDILKAGPRPPGLLLLLGQLHGGRRGCILVVVVGDEGLQLNSGRRLLVLHVLADIFLLIVLLILAWPRRRERRSSRRAGNSADRGLLIAPRAPTLGTRTRNARSGTCGRTEAPAVATGCGSASRRGVQARPSVLAARGSSPC